MAGNRSKPQRAAGQRYHLHADTVSAQPGRPHAAATADGCTPACELYFVCMRVWEALGALCAVVLHIIHRHATPSQPWWSHSSALTLKRRAQARCRSGWANRCWHHDANFMRRLQTMQHQPTSCSRRYTCHLWMPSSGYATRFVMNIPSHFRCACIAAECSVVPTVCHMRGLYSTSRLLCLWLCIATRFRCCG